MTYYPRVDETPVFQMVRIGDILDIESVDDWEHSGITLYDVLCRKQDDHRVLDTIYYGIEKYGYWKTGILQIKSDDYPYSAHFESNMRHGDGHHRLTLMYLLLGEDAWIPYRFSETGYMNETNSREPDNTSDSLPEPFTFDEIVEWSAILNG